MQQFTPWPITIQNPWHPFKILFAWTDYTFASQRADIPSKQCNKEATELVTHLVSSHYVVWPFWLYIHLNIIYVSIIYVISGLREACTYMSLREACEKLARVWRHSIS